ncbi:BrnA antitoxin family protein [Massilia suwonensis]|uniref:BrnA antitoxin family protein n=1 Tax=Massilia suwonensis TaxID=648895 RepID=A0ABW0MML2_9BURK
MDSMNKEYEPDWDQPSLQSHMPAVEPKAAPSGAKQIVTIRLDVDMLDWFKAAGPGYQTRINQVLREHMDAQRALEVDGN